MIRKAILWSLLLLAMATAVYVRFTHPNLTETQLFIDFWYVWLCVSMAVMSAAILLRKYE